MEFKTLFKILKNRIGDGCDVPEFFRELIAMITAVSEEEWGTGKDPSMRALLDNTYRSYVKRKLPKKFAQSIVYHLNMDNLIRNINDTPLELRKLLLEDLIPYDSDMTVHNVAEKIADYMIEIIRASAGMTNPNTLIESKRQEIALSLKRKYGDFLYLEEGNCCPGCGRNLYVMLNDSVRPVYEIAIIDKSKSPVVTNLLAMCPICQATHQLDNNKKRIRELQSVKKILSIHRQNINLIDDMKLEKGITGAIIKIKELKQADLEKASLDPKEIKQKLDPNWSAHCSQQVCSLQSASLPTQVILPFNCILSSWGQYMLYAI